MRLYKEATKIIIEQMAEAQFHLYMGGSDHRISNVAAADTLAAVYDMDAKMILEDLNERVPAAYKAFTDNYYDTA